MRARHVPAAFLIGGLGLISTVPAAGAAAPAQPGNCVSHFTSTLGKAGVAGSVISAGAKEFAPFGHNVVRGEAHAPLGECPFVPEDFLPQG
jgi:hypothetical protein